MPQNVTNHKNREEGENLRGVVSSVPRNLTLMEGDGGLDNRIKVTEHYRGSGNSRDNTSHKECWWRIKEVHVMSRSLLHFGIHDSEVHTTYHATYC